MSNEMSRVARAVISTVDGPPPAPRQRRRAPYDVAKSLLLGLFWVQNIRVRIEGAANIPLTGGVVLTPNHRAYYDMLPVHGPMVVRGDRKPHALLKKEAFANRWITKLFVELGGIPVDRTPGKGGQSLTEAADALARGEVVAVFLQGTIRHEEEIGELKTGAVRMAAQSGAVIVPVGCSGTQKLWTRGQRPRRGGRRVTVHVVVGEPFTASGDVGEDNRELQERMQQVKDRADRADQADRSYSGR
ncbi:MAG: 1-acyl-sn-glycerol-3-phosphate acyltransferase [Corynebacterium sp.]|nr:1-acyl-sn-glycerol-3-phosphate acyltransferase [Corynebacterium sp.]